MYRLENRGNTTMSIIDKQAEKIASYYTRELTSKFHVEVDIPEDVAKILAYLSLSRGGETIWLNGKSLKLNELVLRLKLDYQPEVIIY